MRDQTFSSTPVDRNASKTGIDGRSGGAWMNGTPATRSDAARARQLAANLDDTLQARKQRPQAVPSTPVERNASKTGIGALASRSDAARARQLATNLDDAVQAAQQRPQVVPARPIGGGSWKDQPVGGRHAAAVQARVKPSTHPMYQESREEDAYGLGASRGRAP